MAKRNTLPQGPKFLRYINPILTALNELGGSGRPSEIFDYIAEHEEVDDEENELLTRGTLRFNKNVSWARFYLAKTGYIDGSTRGVWRLTEKGRGILLSDDEIRHIFYSVQNDVKNLAEDVEESDSQEVIETTEDFVENNHRKLLMQILLNLPPSGFERLCQRLLRESGFEQVNVTGRSGDGGIDGNGLLKMNHFVSFQIAFQCKRYKGSVGPDVIRDFRGSIMGRSDKGIILTTGTFTNDARREAKRDGATPIELVDAENIIGMLEELELGLTNKRTKTIYDIDQSFFDEFAD